MGKLAALFTHYILRLVAHLLLFPYFSWFYGRCQEKKKASVGTPLVLLLLQTLVGKILHTPEGSVVAGFRLRLTAPIKDTAASKTSTSFLKLA